MTTFQSAVNFGLGAGIPGEMAYDGPMRAFPWTLVSSPQINTIGATAYTVVSDGIATAGGIGAFCGILVNPKVYAQYSAVGNALAPTMVLPDETVAELATMGIFYLQLTTAANAGDLLAYNTTTGALLSVPMSGTVTASFATNVMTVTGTPSTPIGPGTIVSGTGIPAGTSVTSNGSGSGGAGTYNLSTTPGTIPSASFSTAPGTNAGTGNAFVPRSKVILRSTAANGLAIVELTD